MAAACNKAQICRPYAEEGLATALVSFECVKAATVLLDLLRWIKMKLNQFSVSQKLWALVIGLLVGLLLVSAGSLIYLDRVYVSISKEATRTRMAANIASEWRHLTEQSVDRSIVAAISSEENLVEQQRKLMSDGIAHITELQKKLNELVTDEESRKVLDEVAERRRATLESNAAVQAARKDNDFAAAFDLVESSCVPMPRSTWMRSASSCNCRSSAASVRLPMARHASLRPMWLSVWSAA